MSRFHEVWAWGSAGLLLSLASCGGESIAFRSDDTNHSAGGSTSAGGVVVGGDWAGGSTAASGGAGAGGFGAGGGIVGVGFARAAYGGGMPVLRTGGTVQQPAADASCVSPGTSSHFYEASTCTAGSICAPSCTKDADCPALAGIPTVCEECVPGMSSCDTESACVLPCSSGADCPSDMSCLEGMCMFSDVPWAPGCDGYCARGTETCGVGVPCCDNMVCSPWGTCEARECLPFAWECGVALPSCCDPFACRDGYCQSTP